MVRINVVEFDISDRAEAKFWGHGITRRQVRELLQNRMRIVSNRKDRVAKFVVIGRDASGRCIAVPVLPTEDPIVWRPVTAWYCKPSEATRLG